MEIISKKLKVARLALGLNQINMANLSGLSQRDISMLENNKKTFIPVPYIQFMLDRQLDLNWLFDDKADPDQAEFVEFSVVGAIKPKAIAQTPPIDTDTETPNYPSSSIVKKIPLIYNNLKVLYASNILNNRPQENLNFMGVEIAVDETMLTTTLMMVELDSYISMLGLRPGDWILCKKIDVWPSPNNYALAVTEKQMIVKSANDLRGSFKHRMPLELFSVVSGISKRQLKTINSI